jgi:hypothetical protein
VIIGHDGLLFEADDDLERCCERGEEAGGEDAEGAEARDGLVQADVGCAVSEQKHANGREQLRCL